MNVAALPLEHGGPEVSIVVVVDHSVEGLARCLASLAGQSFLDFEVIVVDRTQGNETSTVVAEFRTSNHRLKAVLVAAVGSRAQARRVGVDCAVGSYVAFLPAVDWIEPWHIETLVTRAMRDNADVVQSSVRVDAMDTANSVPRRRGDARRFRGLGCVSAVLQGVVVTELGPTLIRTSLCRALHDRVDLDVDLDLDIVAMTAITQMARTVIAIPEPSYCTGRHLLNVQSPVEDDVVCRADDLGLAFADCRRVLAARGAAASDVAAFFEREFAAPLRAALRPGASLASAPAGLPQSPPVLGLLGAVIWRCLELSDDPRIAVDLAALDHGPTIHP